MTLYDINKVIDENIIFDEETGELLPFSESLEELELLKEEKIFNIGYVILNLSAELDSLKEIVKRFQEKKSTVEKNIFRLEDYLKANVSTSEKYKNDLLSISWRKSESVEVDIEPEKLPMEFVRIKCEPDKVELKKALKDGQKIYGTRLLEKYNLQIKN
jgi:hypothetical protein